MRNVILVLGLLSRCTIVNAAALDCTQAPAIGSNVLNLNPMGCSGGGLTFDLFSVTSAPPGTTVFLSGLGTGPVASPQGFSLGFQLTAPNPPVETFLQYRVTAQPGFTIVNVDNAHNGVDTGVTETVCSVPFVGHVCPAGNVLANFTNPPTLMPPAFAPQSVVYIQKDISEPFNTSFISSFVNSQETGIATSACPVGVNALQMLVGTWIFSVEGFTRSSQPYASAGQFVASIGPNYAGLPTGLLKIATTSTNARLETDVGSFQIFPDCSGGTLTFNLSTGPIQFDFWFANGGTEIRFVSTSPGVDVHGSAVAGASTCPVGVNPLQALVGTWTFSAEGFAPLTRPFNSAGQFVATIGNNYAGIPTGLLKIVTSSTNARLEMDVGTFQIFPDCSGGTLTFNLSTGPVQFDFWFVNGGKEIRFVSTTSGVEIHGSAKR